MAGYYVGESRDETGMRVQTPDEVLLGHVRADVQANVNAMHHEVLLLLQRISRETRTAAPTQGTIDRLSALMTELYARFQRVQGLQVALQLVDARVVAIIAEREAVSDAAALATPTRSPAGCED